MREAFEAWLRSRWPNAVRPIDEKTPAGTYWFSENNILWEAYQAAYAAGMTRAAEVAYQCAAGTTDDVYAAIRAEITKGE